MKYNEEENILMDMLCETNEDIRNTLFEKYEPTIKYLVKKYTNNALKLGLDYNDLFQEANVAFTDALNNFNPDRETSLKTFISLCVERRLINVVERAKSQKNKIIQESLSLDYDYNQEGLPLKEILGDEKMDPYMKYSEQENTEQLMASIQEQLSDQEMNVFSYMINGLNYQEIAEILDKSPKQIDNTMQRVRAKVRTLLKNMKVGDSNE